MPLTACPHCGYQLDPFDLVCARCKKKPSDPIEPKPGTAAAPPPTPQAAPDGPTIEGDSINLGLSRRKAGGTKPSGQAPAASGTPAPVPQAAPPAAPAPVSTGAPPVPTSAPSVGPAYYCAGCRKKITQDMMACPNCGRATPFASKMVTPGKAASLESQRAMINYGLIGVAFLAIGGGIWGWINYSGQIKYGIAGQSDIRYQVETRMVSADGRSTHVTGISTYYFKQGLYRQDVEAVDPDYDRPISYIARCDTGKLHTVDFGLSMAASENIPWYFSPGGTQFSPLARSETSPSSRLAGAPADCCGVSRAGMEPFTGTNLLGLVTGGGMARVRAKLTGDSGSSVVQAGFSGATPRIRLVQATSEDEDKNAGKIVRSYKIEKLGQDTIADVSTYHYRLTTKVTMSGCAGNGETTEQMEVWVAPSIYNKFECPEPTPAPASNAQATPTPVPTPQPTPIPVPMPYAVPVPSPPAPGATPIPGLFPLPKQSACKITQEQEGNLDDFSSAFRGLVMRLRVMDGDKVTMEQEVRNISQKEIERSNFDVSFQPVTSGELWAKRSAAISKQRMDKMKRDAEAAAKATPSGTPSGTPEAMPAGTPEATLGGP